MSEPCDFENQQRLFQEKLAAFYVQALGARQKALDQKLIHVGRRVIKSTGKVGAKRGDPADVIMPEIGEILLPFIVPRRRRADVMGDLAEEFRTYAARRGRPYALLWFWWEVAGLCIRRFGLTVVIAIGEWVRQRLG